ncbi:MAG: sugar phosphate nucleotidyltransferase [Acidimicrobiales bacterium]
MKAIVLVGGLGTRLRPLTLDTPKQLLPIVDRPMLEWVLEGLARNGVDEAILAIGYRPDAFSEAYPDGRCAGLALRYAVEPEPLDTAGAIRFAARDAGIDERFVVVNGDVLTDLDLGALLAFHDSRKAEATIALHRVEDPSRYGVVPTDARGRVVAFVEKPLPGEAPSELINAGTYVLEPQLIDRIAAGRKVSIERETFPTMIADGGLYAMDDGGVYWLDTGTALAYVQAQVDIIEGRRGPLDVVAIDPSAQIDGADIRSSVVQAGVSVGAGAVLERAVVLSGATVGPGAKVSDSVIGAGAIVGAGAAISGGTIVGRGEHVAPHAHLNDARIPGDS